MAETTHDTWESKLKEKGIEIELNTEETPPVKKVPWEFEGEFL